MKSHLFAIGLALQASNAAASELMGIGLSPCAEYTKAVQDKQDDRYLNWAFGFMSGANAVFRVDGNQKDLAALTLDDEKQAFFNYCHAHPSAQFFNAVIDLTRVLPLSSQTVFAGHNLPLEIGGATRFSIHDYETMHPGLGHAAGYRHHGAISTVYFYNAGIASIPDDLKSPELDAQFQQSLSDIHGAKPPGAMIDTKAAFVISDDQAKPRLNCIGLNIKEANAEAKDSYLCIGPTKGTFFKVRTTMLQNPDSEAEVRQFINAWGQDLWH